MNVSVIYLVIGAILAWVFFKTRNLKANDNEYFVLNKSEGVLGLTLAFTQVVWAFGY